MSLAHEVGMEIAAANGRISRQDLALMNALGVDSGERCVGAFSAEEWGSVCRRAVERRVAHLLYARLKRQEGIPAAVREELRRHYLASAADNSHRVVHLKRVLAQFRDRGIEVVVLKGAYLAESVYRDIALRTMGDVDLLVREADLERAKAALLEDGFRQCQATPLDTTYQEHHHLVPFVRDGKRPLTIELHRRLLASLVADAGIWERSRPARVCGVEVRVLCPEDLLLHICMHACLQHHLAMGVTPLVDVDVILRAFASEMDWETFIARAEDWGAGGSAALMLWCTSNYLGAGIPDGVLDRLAPGGVSPEVAKLADDQIFGNAHAAFQMSITLSRLRHAGGLREFVAILGERSFPSPAELLIRHRASSQAMLPLLYLLHPFVLLTLHGRSAVKMMLGGKREQAADAAWQKGLALEKALSGKGSLNSNRR